MLRELGGEAKLGCMGKKKLASENVWLRPRLRVMRKSEIALGPGRVDLLELIGETGSLQAAAKRMGISYMRAWTLVKYTNRCFSEPVVEAVRGGRTGGGANLTEAGRKAVRLYRRMEQQSQTAVKGTLAKLRKALRP
jgi:molybdate transport system regulatory protein